MAHVIVEWTGNLVEELDIRGLLSLIAARMRDDAGGAFPVGGIRVRGIRLDDYVIADDLEARDAFINVSVLMGVGRSAEFRSAFFDRMFTAIEGYLAEILDRRPTALSMYVTEVEGWKRNTIHDRLKGN